VLDGTLKLDFEMAIPGRGEPKSRTEVEAYREKFAQLHSGALPPLAKSTIGVPSVI